MPVAFRGVAPSKLDTSGGLCINLNPRFLFVDPRMLRLVRGFHILDLVVLARSGPAEPKLTQSTERQVTSNPSRLPPIAINAERVQPLQYLLE